MKSKYVKLLLGTAFMTGVLTSCYETPTSREQYKPEVYMVGANEKVQKRNFPFKPKGEMATNFITIFSSGSRRITEKVQMKLVYRDSLVDIYNRKNFSTLASERHKWYKLIDLSKVNIPTMDNVELDPTKSIYVNVPIEVETHGMDADSLWVIPLHLAESSPYPINPTGRNMLVSVTLVNDFSGSYVLEGRDSIPGDVRGYPLNKPKQLKAMGLREVRLFYGGSNEGRNYLDANAIKLTVAEEKNEKGHYPVTITAWKSLNIKEQREAYYDPEKKEFVLLYLINENNQDHLIQEILRFKESEKE